MFKKEDFDLTLEELLKLRVVKDEINSCSDIDQLKGHFVDSIELLMKYQHILNRLLLDQIEVNIGELDIKEME